MNRTTNAPASAGFTLIELMITVVIIGILASIAYPSFVSFVQKSRRSDAKTALLSAAQRLEQYRTMGNTYAGAALGTNGVYANQSENGYYALTLSVPPAQPGTYSLQATPQGAQAGDHCGTFGYDQAGNKTVAGGTLAASNCW